MYIWLDDIREIPESARRSGDGCVWVKSVNKARCAVEEAEAKGIGEFLLDLDHDLGDYAADDGDAVKLVLWLIETKRNNSNYKVILHTANPVGRENMRALIDRYWDTEI